MEQRIKERLVIKLTPLACGQFHDGRVFIRWMCDRCGARGEWTDRVDRVDEADLEGRRHRREEHGRAEA